MSCRTYINRLTNNVQAQNELERIHNSIFQKLRDSKLFNKWNEYTFLPPVGTGRYIQAKALINTINNQYGVPVVGTDFTKANAKEFAFVNVRNLVPNIVQSQELVEQEVERGDYDVAARGEYFSTTDVPSTVASKDTVSKVKDFLKQIGVDIQTFTRKEAKELIGRSDWAGIADMVEQTVYLIEGREDVAITEEAAHFAVEILEQTNPTLYREMFNKIGNYNMYYEVKNSPKYREAYRTDDDKLDIVKLKKEAIGKVLAEYIVKNVDGKSEAESLIEDISRVEYTKNWWDKVVDWLRQLFAKGNNPFQELATSIIEGTFKGDASVIKNNNQYFNLEKQDEVFNKIKAESQVTLKEITETDNRYIRNGEVVKNRVTDSVKEFYNKTFKSKTSSPLNEFIAQKGTDGHADIEAIFKKYIDDEGRLRLDTAGNLAPTDGDLVSRLYPTTKQFIRLLEENIADRLNKYNTDYPGTRFLLEAVIYDPRTDTAGTMDFVAVRPDGTVDILDWKFITLDTRKYKDIPWYKQEAYDIQISEYKKILRDIYGVKDFGTTAAIPISVNFNNKDGVYSLRKLKIGNVDVSKEKFDYLLPVATKDQSTGDPIIDEQISKLRALYNKISDTPVVEGRKDIKKEQLNSLYHTLRQLQIKKNFDPFFKYVDVLGTETENIINLYKNAFKDIDVKAPSNEQINEFSKRMMELNDKFNPFYEIGINLNDVFTTEEDKKKLADASQKIAVSKSKVDKLIKEFADRFLGERYDIVGLSLAEKEYKGLAAIFRPLSKGGTSAMQSLYKMTEPIINRIAIEQREALQDYQVIVDQYEAWAKSKGMTPKDMFNPIFKSKKQIDGNYRSYNQRINTINSEFFTEYEKARDAEGIKWFRENIDLEAYKEKAEERKIQELELIEDYTFDSDPDVNESMRKKRKSEIEAKYDISTPKSLGWGSYFMRQFPIRKWYSTEYEYLLKEGNEPALNFYNYIGNLTDQAAKLGIIDPKVKNSFLPFVRKNGLAEKMVFGGQYKVLQGFADAVTIMPDDYSYGYRDPLTGKLVYDIRARYTTDISNVVVDEKGNKTRDYNEVSTNLFKTIQLFTDEVIRYKGLREITDSVRLLLEAENMKDSLQTNERGDIIRVGGEPQTTRGNDKNYNTLLQHVMGRVYGIKSDESELNVTLGKIGDGWDRNAKAINKTLGYELIPKLSGREISVPKLVDAGNHYFTSKVLSLNVGILTSNIIGGKMQAMINSGNSYYTRNDLAAAEAKLASVAFKDEKGRVLMGLIKTLYPFVDERQRDKYIKVTASKLADTSFVSDILMAPHKYGSMLVEMPHIIAMLENAVVVDGKIVNANKYVRSKYNGRYRMSPSERKDLEKKIENEIKELKSQSGLTKVATMENNKVIIPGINMTDSSVLDYRSLIINLAKDFLGAVDSNDMNLANRKLMYKSFLVFKNWIPPLLDKRLGDIRYSPGIDKYEYGRFRMVGKMIWSNGLRSASIMKNIMEGNDKGVAYVTDLLQKKKEQYKKRTGKDLNITEDDFIDLVRSNIKEQLYDTMFFMFLGAAVIGLYSLAPDGDDLDPEAKGYWNFAKRMSNKLFDEIRFYYSPLSFTEILNGSIFPGLGIANDIYNFSKNVLEEGYGFVVNDDEITEGAHPMKYLLKFSPFANNLSLYTAVASPDFAKSMGIQINESPRGR